MWYSGKSNGSKIKLRIKATRKIDGSISIKYFIELP